MDKFEYKVRSEEIKALIARKEYAEAVKIADTIDWRRVRSVMMLCTISDLYKINRRLEDSKNILLMAYDRHPGGRTIIYSLCELCIKTEDIVGAIEYYKEFVQVAPRDTGRFILQYKLYEAQDVSLEERIAVLEEFKKRDYREKWAYELAYLYHRIGLATKCVEECDDLILWFGEGKYVIKAMELKMLHEPLTPDQQLKYNNRFVKNVEDSMTRVLPTVQIQEAVKQSEQQLSHTQEILEAPTQRLPLEEIDIQVKMVDVGQYDTINMQKELAESLQEILPPGQEITPETGIIQPERIEEAMMQGGFQPEMMQGGYAVPEMQTEYAQPEMGYAPEAYATQEEHDSESAEVPEEVQAWGEASPAFTFYDNKSEQLAAELAAWNQVESAAFTFYSPTTGNTTTFTPEEQAKLEEDLANWNKAESTAFTFYDPKTGNTTTFTPEEQEKLVADLAAWNQVKSAAFTFYDFKGEAQKIAQQQAEAEASQPVAEVYNTQPEEEPAQVLVQDEIARAIVAPLLQETGDMSDVATQLEEQRSVQPSGGMTEVFFGETGEIRIDPQYTQGSVTAYEEPVEEQPTVPEIDTTSQIVMDQIKEDVIAAKMAASEPAAIPPQALPSQPLDKILSMEYDGQLSMVMPDDERIEKQITGQLSIEDILSEWERMKKESEAKCMESVRQRVLQQTGDMFAEFDEAAKSGLLEQLEGLAQATEAAQEIEAEDVETESGAEEVFYEAEVPEEMPEPSEVESGVEEVFFQEDEEVVEEIEEELTDEEAVAEEEPVEDTEEIPEETLTEELPAEQAEENYEEELSIEDYPDEPLEDPMPLVTGEEVFFQEEDSEEVSEEEDSEEELGNFFAPRAEETDTEEDSSKVKEAGAEVYFSDKSEETTEEDSDNEVSDEVSEEVEEAPEKPRLRDFTREERELFASFVQDRASKEQLIQTLENISLASYTGNVIVTGEEAETTFALAKNLVRNFQMSDPNFSGKIAKISGDGLNKKNIPETVTTLENGALLIQNASGMNEETVKRLVKALEQENRGIIVVLEDTKKSMNRLLEKNEALKNIFNSRVDIKAMDNDSLVEFAKKYAYEKEYSIDEMGVLALHTRIADMQTLDHAVTVAEVKEIMDEAIESANRKSISHFFDVVLSKRYDEEDMIVLREKDFI